MFDCSSNGIEGMNLKKLCEAQTIRYLSVRCEPFPTLGLRSVYLSGAVGTSSVAIYGHSIPVML